MTKPENPTAQNNIDTFNSTTEAHIRVMEIQLERQGDIVELSERFLLAECEKQS